MRVVERHKRPASLTMAHVKPNTELDKKTDLDKDGNLEKNGRPAADKDARWKSIVKRDRKADGTFFYSVKTTGVYCRPSCAARLAKPENVQYHATCKDAEREGFRPCKRCKPDQASLADQHAATIAKVCKVIESSDVVPSLEELAAEAGLSVYHFHRLFKSNTGLTPKEYAEAHRSKRMRDELGRTSTVTEAIFEAGFNSSGRFYEKTDAVLGMTPSAFRKGGANLDIRYAIGKCSLGNILVAQTDKGICAIFISDDREEMITELNRRFPKANLIGDDKGFKQVVEQVVAFVEAPALGFNLPLDVRGTAFQQRVWQALRKIPAGTTVSYSDIANMIGTPKAVRAVGTACGANHIAVAIPCHRVLRTDGDLGGYRWGLERKRKLLDREANK